MPHRQQQHLGRDTEQEKNIAGRDHREKPDISEESNDEAEAARDVSRAIDRNEGDERTE